MRSLSITATVALLGAAWVFGSRAMTATAVDPQDAVSLDSADILGELAIVRERVIALEAGQKEILRRLEQLQSARVHELESLLAFYRGGATSAAPASTGGAVRPAGLAVQPAAGGEDEPEEEPSETPPERPSEPSPEAAAAALVAHYIETAKELIAQDEFATAYRVLSLALKADPGSAEALFHRGVSQHLLKRYPEAIVDWKRSAELTKRANVRYTCFYNLACAQALTGHLDEAVELLEKSYAEGYTDIVMQMATDSDLDSLRDHPRFREFLQKLRTP